MTKSDEENELRLPLEDQHQFADALANPREPNEALRKAMERRKELETR